MYHENVFKYHDIIHVSCRSPIPWSVDWRRFGNWPNAELFIAVGKPMYHCSFSNDPGILKGVAEVYFFQCPSGVQFELNRLFCTFQF